MDIGSISRGMSVGSIAGLTNIGFKLKALFAHLFTNKTTSVDGTRYLVNEGTDGENAVMHTGQGVYFNGVDNYIDTDARATDKCTFILTLNMATGSNDFIAGGSFANSIRIQPDSNKILFRLGNSDYAEFTPSKSIAYNEDITVCLSYEHINGVSQFTLIIDDEVLTNVQNNNPSSYEPFVIASRGSISYWQGIISSFYLLPDFVPTLGQFQAHYNNPEQTLYWDNGVLKSDILDQATIDSMQAGNGFWYPFTENVSAGGYYRNHALPIPSNLVVNGDFDTDSDWDKSDHWTISGGVATMPPTGTFLPIVQTINYADGVDYVVELDITAITGEIKVMSLNVAQDDSITTHITNSTGLIRLIFTGSSVYPKLAISRNRPSALASCSIRNIKVYPLANSGLTPLVNWTTTTPTNASQLTTGYQCALQELDSFGLPIAKPDGLLYIRDNFTFPVTFSAGESYELDFIINFTYREGLVEILRISSYTKLAFTDTAKPFVFYLNGNKQDVFTQDGVKVVTLLNNAGAKSYFINGVFMAEAEAQNLVEESIVVNKNLNDIFANLQITKGTRTDEQRTADVNKLMTKYGVV